MSFPKMKNETLQFADLLGEKSKTQKKNKEWMWREFPITYKQKNFESLSDEVDGSQTRTELDVFIHNRELESVGLDKARKSDEDALDLDLEGKSDSIDLKGNTRTQIKSENKLLCMEEEDFEHSPINLRNGYGSIEELKFPLRTKLTPDRIREVNKNFLDEVRSLLIYWLLYLSMQPASVWNSAILNKFGL